jgi:hypothetical protein
MDTKDTKDATDINITDIGQHWYTYRLSPDGMEFTLVTEKGQAIFSGIEALALEPTSSSLQQAEEYNELDEVVEYRLEDHFVDSQQYWSTDQRVHAIAVGPPSFQAVINCSDRKGLLKYRAFHLSGYFPYILAVTLICREFRFLPRAVAESE